MQSALFATDPTAPVIALHQGCILDHAARKPTFLRALEVFRHHHKRNTSAVHIEGHAVSSMHVALWDAEACSIRGLTDFCERLGVLPCLVAGHVLAEELKGLPAHLHAGCMGEPSTEPGC